MLRTQYLTRIRSAMAIMADEVRMNVISNRLDANISSETVWCGLLNRLYDWELKNANSLRRNFPAVDLVDPARGIAVQVTSDNSREKIQKTLDKLEKADVKCRKLVMMLLSQSKQYRDFQTDGVELVILDREVISRQLEDMPTEKLEKIAAYLDGELGLTTAVEKPRHRLPGVPSPSLSFVEGSRDQELAKLWKILVNKQPAFLWGVGGIGKTETAIQLAKHHAPAKGAYFLRYQDSLRQTILGADFFQGADGERRDLDYDTRMGILRTEYPGALLIIDNFDCPDKNLADLTGEDTYSELTAMDMMLVFTTRSDVGDVGVEIGRLAEKELIGLMRRSYKNQSVSDDRLLQLIRAVDGHTLMVDLMAKTLRESLGAITPEDMLEAFRKGNLKGKKLPSVHKNQQGKSAQGRIDDHLRTLFDMSGMNPSEMAVMRYATLLPEGGMDALLFRTCLDDERREVLQKWHEKLRGKKPQIIPSEQDSFVRLTKTGWLRIDDVTNLLTIHPVIRDVCREELVPNEESCGLFLKNLWGQVDFRQYERVKFAQLAELFAKAADTLEDQDAEWLNRSGRLWGELVQSRKVAELYEKHIPALEKRIPDSLALATACNNVGSTYGALGEHQKELECHLKALAIFEKVLPHDHPEIALSYNNVGSTYNDMGEYQKALERHLKALEIRKAVLPPDHPELAQSYSNVGNTYGNLGDHRNALEFTLKALEIRKEVLPPDHPDVAVSFNNVGGIYADKGDHRMALEYYLKALAILENVLSPDHPNLATSNNNVGCIYGSLGDHQKALEYMLKALTIREKVLPPDHPDVAFSNNNVGVVYGDMGEYDKALRHLEKALDIRQRILPAGHPHIAATEDNIAWTWEKMEQQ